jgi:hypothetical protein
MLRFFFPREGNKDISDTEILFQVLSSIKNEQFKSILNQSYTKATKFKRTFEDRVTNLIRTETLVAFPEDTTTEIIKGLP